MINSKKWYKSKTYWFNIAIAIVGLMQINVELFRNILGDNCGIAVVIIGVVGILLRNTTTDPIKGTKNAR